MNTEVREALERLRRIHNGEPVVTVYGHPYRLEHQKSQYNHPYHADLRLVVEWVLAEYPEYQNERDRLRGLLIRYGKSLVNLEAARQAKQQTVALITERCEAFDAIEAAARQSQEKTP